MVGNSCCKKTWDSILIQIELDQILIQQETFFGFVLQSFLAGYSFGYIFIFSTYQTVRTELWIEHEYYCVWFGVGG